MAKILLVEDDNNLREIYGARLMAEGYKIVAAADGEEALAMAVKEKPDLIISDVMMPKISGFDMLDILRTTAETKNTKVIMMTALSQPEDRERGEKLGADRYLVKSQVTLEDVVAVVHEVLEDGGGAAAIPAPTAANPDAAEPTPTPSSPTPEPTPTTDTPADKPVAPTPASASEAQEPAAPEAASAPEPTPAAKPEVEKTETEPNVVEPTKPETPADTPEPASKKKKIIEPINNLDTPDIQKLAEAEEAKEKETAPGSAIDPQAGNTPDVSETIAQEKKEVEEQIKEFVDSNPSDAPTPTTDKPEAAADTTSEPKPATTEETSAAPTAPAEPAAPVDTTTETPAVDPNAPNPNDIAL